VTLEHKNCQFLEINNLSIDVWFVWTIFENLEGCKKKIEILMKSPLKLFLAMHIINQKLSV